MIYEILLPLPIQKTFYYEQSNLFSESKKLSSGTLVEVEFKKKLIIGMILNSVKSHSLNKPIKKIHKIFNTISFNKEIINSINFISQYSCNKSSMILKLFLSSFSAKKYDNDFKDLKLEISNKPLKLNLNQIDVINQIKKINFNKFNVILLEGVTGSGKTRVYMQKAKEIIEKGYQCLILVPEIILTTQWVEDIRDDFGIDPSVYHSSVKKKEREKIWVQSNLNQVKLVIGTRSALFLPFSNLGLIVVDEEHDSSYKQEEQLIINARDFSIVRAKNSNCLAILTSATPSLESFHNVKIGKFKHFKLTKRVNNFDLPNVKIIDMKREKDIISQDLNQIIKKNLMNNYQTLIFINKRGYSPFVICKNCGFSKICKNCNTTLVLHNHLKKNSFLLCHHCNYKEVFENLCQSCGQKDSFTFPGFGIEKVCEIITKRFPKAKTCILSSDTVKNSSKFKNVVSEIVLNKINIIIGTQLISKGHNFPSLKTVGILNIDNLMNDFDFRSYEKAFQQIVQVGGRAGRKNFKGEVVIQTLQPNHPVIKLCVNKDNQNFINWELKSREANNQPPFINYISLIISSKQEHKASNYSIKIYQQIIQRFNDLKIFGPAPAVLYKKNSYFRYRILIKLTKELNFQKNIKNFLMKIKPPNNLKLYVDVDPINFV